MLTPAAKERSHRLTEFTGALMCATLVLLGTTPMRDFWGPVRVLLWFSWGCAWETSMSISVVGYDALATAVMIYASYLTAFGLLDRVRSLYTDASWDWRCNWMLIPFLGAAFFFLNHYWYFPVSSFHEAGFDFIVTYTVGVGMLLLPVMFVCWLCGLIYRLHH